MSIGAPKVGVETMMVAGPTGSNPSSSKRRRRHPSRKIVASKNRNSPRLSASLPQESGEASDRLVALTTSVSTPMVIEIEDSIAEIPTAEGGEVETVAARHRTPYTPRVHTLIMDLAGALVVSLDPELSGTALLEAVKGAAQPLLDAIKKEGSQALVDKLNSFLAEILDLLQRKEA